MFLKVGLGGLGSPAAMTLEGMDDCLHLARNLPLSAQFSGNPDSAQTIAVSDA